MGLGKHSLVERLFADGVFAIIENAPTVDAVQVVRCKDCVHYNELECNHIFSTLKDDDFCSYGERIENIGD